MVEAQHRIRQTIRQSGETYTVGTINRKGVVTLMSPRLAALYLTQAIIDNANRPLYAIFVPDNDATVATDTISWDGLTLSILKIVRRRLRGTLLFKIILAH